MFSSTNQIYVFGMLTTVVIVTMDRLSSQTLIAQMISGALVLTLIWAYATTFSNQET